MVQIEDFVLLILRGCHFERGVGGMNFKNSKGYLKVRIHFVTGKK